MRALGRIAVLRGHFRFAAAAAPRALAPAAAVQRRACGGGLPEPDIDGIAYGFMASQALFTALELGVFDAVAQAGEKGMLYADVAAAVGVQAPRLQTLLTALTAHSLLRRSEDGHYTCSQNTSKFLVKGSKYYYGDYLRFQVGRQFYNKMANLPKIMTTGEAPTYAEWFADSEEARMYTEAQHNGSLATAKQLLRKLDLSGVRDFLDVGGGSGAFSIVLCRTNPETRAQVIELPEVAKTGMGFVSKEDPAVAGRIQYISGTALDSWPLPDQSQDCVLMSYLSGSVPEGMLVSLYTEANRVLRPGGRLLVHDFMVADLLNGPAGAANWALAHVSVNAKGLGLCPGNVSAAMDRAGLTQNEKLGDMIGGLTQLVVATKP